MISERTKAALAAAKARGVKLGGDHGARLTQKARQAGWEARMARADAKAADLRTYDRRITGRWHDVAAGHRVRVERSGHPHRHRCWHVAGRAG
jgi:hypothetical protein